MYTYLYVTIFSIIILVSIYSFTNKNKKDDLKIVYSEKAFLQSPEYRCSTKCFDCVKERTFQHLNPSHGNPKINVGL